MLRTTRLSFPTVVLLVASQLALALVLAQPADAQTTTFADLEGAGSAPAIEVLAEEGIMQGCAEGQFCPDGLLTRGQLATILTRALELPVPAVDPEAAAALAADPSAGTIADPTDDPSTEPSADPVVVFTEEPFGDLAGNVHVAGILAIAAAGITAGCTDEAFCPDEPMTRAQLASMLDRALELPAAPEPLFDGSPAIHRDAIDRLATVGIAAGCGDPLWSFCGDEPVLRRHAASFVARALGLVEPVQLTSLEQRRAEQDAIDEERARIAAEEEAARVEAERLAERERIWDRLAQCESGGNWSINTGNGYYGGLQFSLSSWRWVGGSGYPHHHSKQEQIRRAEILLSRQGWGAWPACSRKLGLR